uniref:Uncharacterized protein n=1 Tax=Brugia timori TaxID=42155 RepID=A0A0R3QEK2_9BILA
MREQKRIHNRRNLYSNLIHRLSIQTSGLHHIQPSQS